jgi:hypothetical protein
MTLVPADDACSIRMMVFRGFLFKDKIDTDFLTCDETRLNADDAFSDCGCAWDKDNKTCG